jgi:CheY-like chemotaxis protein
MTATRLTGVRILLVEDYAPIREHLAEWLRLEGASVVPASTGKQALAVAGAQEFDVVLSDLDLPDVPGDVVVRTILSMATRRPRVAIITGAAKVNIAGLHEAGVDAVLPKPFDWSRLIEYLRTGRMAA